MPNTSLHRLSCSLHRLCALVALAALAALATACCALAPSAHAAQAGVVVDGSPEFSPFASSQVSALGVRWVRGFVNWGDAEPTRGRIDSAYLAAIDGGMYSLPPGTRVILDVVGAPAWETGSSQPNAPPRRASDYAAFMSALAAHFRGRVAAWEIWNEEDLQQFWAGAPDPAAYVRLLRATYPVIKAVDPGSTVVLGGLTGNDYPFLDGVYAAGGKGYFDVVGVHTDTACNLNSPYVFLRNRGGDGRINQWSFLAYRAVHATMLAHGDDKPIWMTEIGWNTSTGSCSHGTWAGQKNAGVSYEQQAQYLLQAYHCLAGDPYVQVALWFGLQDGPAGDHFGLLDAGLNRKPAFDALADYARNGDRLTGPCGDFSGPRITLASPTDDQSYRGPLLITVSATDPVGVPRITLLHDGRVIRNYSDWPGPTTLTGQLRWQGATHLSVGPHTLTILAMDRLGNTSRTTIIVRHMREKPGRRPRRRKRH
jgi:Bacterial Ig domain